MSVDSTHPSYDKRVKQWRRLRDASEGEDAIKDAGTLYLRMLGGQDHSEYEAYKNRAPYYNATGRTIDGLSGMIFRKPPIIEHPEGMNDFMEDVTLGDLDFQGFAEGIVEEALTPGRAGILVDFPRVEVGGLTQADADRMNLRPFLSMYRAESILNWKVGQIGNRTVITEVRLQECVEEEVDEFEREEIEQIRILDLDEDTKYRQRVFRRNENGKWEQHSEDIYPEMRGNRLEYIPFIFVGPRDTTPHVCKPPLIDLANVNIDHWQQSADYTHARHFTAAGLTPYGTGVTAEEIRAGAFETLGPTGIWLSTSTEAKFGILEPEGAALPELRESLRTTEQYMAHLGARMLAPDKKAAETAETANIRMQGEMSVLASLSMSVSHALTKALEIARDWMGLTGDVMVRLNTDFTPKGMSSQMFQQWIQAVQSGQVSGQEFFDAMQEGELIHAEKTYEEHQAELEEQGPMLLAGE